MKWACPRTKLTSVGFSIQGKTIAIQGADRSSTQLVTGAGYGVLVEDADVALWDLTITGGVRAEDGNATDAAVVVRRSAALIENVAIEDNTDLRDGTDTYPGIAGVAGREESIWRSTSRRSSANSFTVW